LPPELLGVAAIVCKTRPLPSFASLAAVRYPLSYSASQRGSGWGQRGVETVQSNWCIYHP